MSKPRVTDKKLGGMTDARQRAFLLAFRETAIVRDGLEAAKVTRQSLWLWKKDSAFLRLFEDAQEDAWDELERHALYLAKHAKKPNPIMTIFLLKGARPEKYRDNVSISGHDGGPLFRVVAGISPAAVCGTETPPMTGKGARQIAAEFKRGLLTDGKEKEAEKVSKHALQE